jgi:hypothetical protein
MAEAFLGQVGGKVTSSPSRIEGGLHLAAERRHEIIRCEGDVNPADG